MARAREPGWQSGGTLPRADEVGAGEVDLCRGGGRRADQKCPERALRLAVLWRKGSFGSDSEAGDRFAERLLLVAVPCREQGRSLFDFLVGAAEAAVRGIAAPSLLHASLGS
jgi:transposase